jgi:hypothetical protein
VPRRRVVAGATAAVTDLPPVRQRKLPKWTGLRLDEALTLSHGSEGWPAFSRIVPVVPGGPGPNRPLNPGSGATRVHLQSATHWCVCFGLIFEGAAAICDVLPAPLLHNALVEYHDEGQGRIVDRTTDSSDFRIEIRHCVKPSNPYIWEIYSARKLTRVKRSSRSYPTRGAAMKAGKKALLRMIAPPRDQLVAKPQRESGTLP